MSAEPQPAPVLDPKLTAVAQALAAASHDLRSPLALLAGYLELLAAEKLGPLTGEQRTALGEMKVSSDRLSQLVGDFSLFAEFHINRLNMRFRPADLAACIEEARALWLPRFQKKQIALYMVQGKLPPTFVFDYFRIQRVLSNLLDNALKFTDRGGSVWIECDLHFWERRTRLAAATEMERRRRVLCNPNSVRVNVCDTGPGISSEYHQEIFTEFVQKDLPKGRNNGLGLGLAIARSLIHAHQGKIWVESEPGRGSKFCFVLPLTANAESQAPQVESGP